MLKLIIKLEKYGWVENCPNSIYKSFSKGTWECMLYWSGKVMFYNWRIGYYGNE